MTTIDAATTPATDVRAAVVASLSGLGIDADEVTDTATLHGDLELDSTETVQVALDLTRHLGTKITLSGLGELPVAELVAAVLAQARDRAESEAQTP